MCVKTEATSHVVRPKIDIDLSYRAENCFVDRSRKGKYPIPVSSLYCENMNFFLALEGGDSIQNAKDSK